MNSKKFYDSAGNYSVDLASTSTLTANRNIKFPDLAGTIALTSGTQTFTGKTFTSPTLTTPTIDGVLYSALNERQIIVDTYALNGDTLHSANQTVWTAPADSIILRVLLNVTAASIGASTLDIGYTAVSSTTSSDTLFDGIDTGAGIGFYDHMNAALDAGANAKAQLAASGKWITADEATGDTTDMRATVYIMYILL